MEIWLIRYDGGRQLLSLREEQIFHRCTLYISGRSQGDGGINNVIIARLEERIL